VAAAAEEDEAAEGAEAAKPAQKKQKTDKTTSIMEELVDAEEDVDFLCG